MKIIYTGSADTKSYSSADLKKAGLDHAKLTFSPGEVVEVPDAVGQALTSDRGLFASDSFAQAEEAAPEESPEEPLPGIVDNVSASEGDAKGKKGKR